MITDYRILSGRWGTVVNFEELVMSYIARGWQPFGGVSINLAVDGDGLEFEYSAQAMVKYDTAATPIEEQP